MCTCTPQDMFREQMTTLVSVAAFYLVWNRVSLLFAPVHIRLVSWSMSFWEYTLLLCLALCAFWEFHFTLEASVLFSVPSLQSHSFIFIRKEKCMLCGHQCVCVWTPNVCVCERVTETERERWRVGEKMKILVFGSKKTRIEDYNKPNLSLLSPLH